MSIADLHVHSNFSDGSDSPEEIVHNAAKSGIHTIALTDHDTVGGIEKAIVVGKKLNVNVIPGIELSADYCGSEIHILGYFVNYNDAYFCKRLEQLREERTTRALEIVQKLWDLGLQIDRQDIFETIGNSTPGRLHVAEAIWLSGYSKNIFDSFKKYLGYGKPAYVKKRNLSYNDTIELIISTGGIPVLAHPYKMNKDSIILELINSGLQGIEVYYPTQDPRLRLKYRNLAKRYGLAITGGSDFHGTRRPGVLLGEITVNQDLVEELKKQGPLIKETNNGMVF